MKFFECLNIKNKLLNVLLGKTGRIGENNKDNNFRKDTAMNWYLHSKQHNITQ